MRGQDKRQDADAAYGVYEKRQDADAAYGVYFNSVYAYFDN